MTFDLPLPVFEKNLGCKKSDEQIRVYLYTVSGSSLVSVAATLESGNQILFQKNPNNDGKTCR